MSGKEDCQADWVRRRTCPPAWPSLGYLYSYRCMGKVGSNLLASATTGPLFRPFASQLHLSTTAINTKNSRSQSLAGDLLHMSSQICQSRTALSPLTASSRRSASRQCSILWAPFPKEQTPQIIPRLRYCGYQRLRRVVTTAYVRR